MFGLSLIHAGFLAAGLAVGLPILIHLLLRQKTRIVPIAGMLSARIPEADHQELDSVGQRRRLRARDRSSRRCSWRMRR